MSDSSRTLHVPDDAAGDRIDVFLAASLGESRSRAAARVSAGEVQIDGRSIGKSHRLVAGEVVTVAAPPRMPTGAAGVPPPPVRYEDDHLLVVAKPAGLVVHPGTGRAAGTLVQALAETGTVLAPAAGELRPGIVHRLDRDTSGLMVVAKTDEAYHGLVAALKRREVHRRYTALAEGSLPARQVTVDAPIGRDPRQRKRFAVTEDGKPALTRVATEARLALPEGLPVGHLSLVSCTLETGRTHQIRVHLAHAGSPVVGDHQYGASRQVAAALDVPRVFLHAAELRFAHPVSGDAVDIVEPLPSDLARVLARLVDEGN